ncbi:MAG: hypothetical protein M3P06_04010 [Acidobacteriota bacterium]|nr:hypothetical protein [Acidobacteriota bacterium]
MTRKEAVRTTALGRLFGAAKAVKKLFTRTHDTPEETIAAPSTYRPAKKKAAVANSTAPARPKLVESDIPLDVLDRAYVPSDTSSKASFRSTGQDHHNDQEFALGVVDDRWNDEDRLTNKSGDPRIGTHGRTYEPAEARAGSRK